MKKKIKAIATFTSLIIFTLALLFVTCKGEPENNQQQTGNPENLVDTITILGGNLVLKTGTSAAVNALVFPETADNKTIQWSSTNTAVATVNASGNITGVAPGISIILAQASDVSNEYDQITVTVSNTEPLKVESINIINGNLNIPEGMIVPLNAAVLPADAGNRNVNWSSSNSAIVSVNITGHITAVALGSAEITATARDGSGITDSIEVNVVESTGGGDNPGSGDIVAPPEGGINIAGDVTIIESSGWLETLFVKWQKTSAAKYNVYYKGENVLDWTKIDDPLIREYGEYFRADILGLKAGTYDVRVFAVDSNSVEGTPATSTGIQVMPHRRYGFAFMNGKIPGAYKMDGTPKDGARIIYITEKTKETVQLAIRRNNATSETLYTGLQNIIGAYENGHEDRPLIVRFVGKITEKANSPFSDSEGTVNLKGPSNQTRPNVLNGMNVTFEGVGNDAVAHGWGFRTSRANSVEIRNLGFMLANTKQKDAVELTGSNNMWVHNNDFFYMKPGSESDQGKGDGSLDIKDCDLVTISFNHFWDAGKASLLGMAKETAKRITYHHNWFNYSDSRHPRVRIHTVHVFNNFYDGIAKYGIGATMGSSIFSERNYFQNSRKPMLISMQGSDIRSGPNAAVGSSAGTFSSENGGIIKAFENYMCDYSKQEYRPWSPTNTIEFDAFEVSSASEMVPPTVTAKRGGAIYSNFDTVSAFYSYTSDTAVVAKQNVQTWAGRYWGGDFTFDFNPATDRPLADTPMPTLLARLQAYQSELVKIQGE